MKTHPASPPRRRFIFSTLQTGLSAAAIALLAGRPVLAAQSASHTGTHDERILNTALAAERQAVAAYQLGAESGLLQKPVLKTAIQFQDHHKQHADALIAAIKKLGHKPNEEQREYNFPTENLKSQADVLRFAAGLERGAVSAYAGAIPLFDNRDLAAAAASILADEAMHWAILRHALGLDPVPGAFFS